MSERRWLRAAAARARRPGFLVPLGLYAAFLAYLGAGVTFEAWDAVDTIANAVLLAGGRVYAAADPMRPPLTYWLLTPLAWAARAHAPVQSLWLFHAAMSVGLALVVALSHLVFSRLFRGPLAWLLTALMAFNPMMLHYSPLVLFDNYSALPAALFLFAAYRYVARPRPRAFAALALTYIIAVLSRTQLCLLVLIPLCSQALDPRYALMQRLRRLAASPAWLLPILGYPAMVVASAVSIRLMSSGGGLPDLHGANATLLTLWSRASRANLPKTIYWDGLVYQLGLAFTAAAGVGLWTCLRSRRLSLRFVALSVLVPFLVLTFLLGSKEARYFIAFAIPLYILVGLGLRTALSRFQSRGRAVLLATAFLAAPWGNAGQELRFLTREPGMHSPLAAQMAKLFEDGAAPDDCVAWKQGELYLDLPSGPYERVPWIGAPNAGFFLERPVVEWREGAAAPDCRWTVEPRDGYAPRWEGGPIARLYRSGSVRSDAYVDGLREPGAR